MKPATNSLVATAALAFASVLSGTSLIPIVRPLMSWIAPGNESAGHAFMALNLLGGVLAAPVIVRAARRASGRSKLVTRLALADGALLLLIALRLPLAATLAVRTIQGALNIGVLSLLTGAVRAGDDSSRGSRYGLLGTAMMLAVALGAPLGTLCLTLGLRAPLVLSAALNFAVALCVPSAQLDERELVVATSWSFRPVWRPALWVFAERFSVGLFVVTFAFHVRSCLAVSDAKCGWMLTAFLVPFALAVYPAGRITDRIEGAVVGAVGLSLYGLGFLALSAATPAQLLLLMPVLGLSSAAIFASAMREAAGAPDSESRVVAMSWLNSAGNLGMMLGTALAGVVSALSRAQGAGPHSAHVVVFGIAGATSLCVAALTLCVLLATQRSLRSVRVRS
ncbi:MAG: MFS transporter [Polyangiaceae bacterium]